MKVHPESVHGVRSEPNFKVFYWKEGHTDAEYMSFPEIKGKTNVHNVHDVHATENFELRQLGVGIFRTIKPVSKQVETIRNMMQGQINQLCACKTWFVI